MAEEQDDLTLVYLWARKESEDEIKALRADNERLRGRVDQLRELDDLSRKEIEILTQKVLLLESVGKRTSLRCDDLENRKEELREENEQFRKVLRSIACTDADCSAVKPFECPIDGCIHGKARAALGEDK